MPDKLLGRFLTDLRNHASDHASMVRDARAYCESKGIPATQRLSEDEQKDILRVIFQRLTERVMTPDSR